MKNLLVAIWLLILLCAIANCKPLHPSCPSSRPNSCPNSCPDSCPNSCPVGDYDAS